jgi:hypothetical protein
LPAKTKVEQENFHRAKNPLATKDSEGKKLAGVGVSTN